MILSYHITNAQNKISGKITDNLTGEAVVGATVYVPELKTGDIADKNGNYTIDKLPRTIITVQTIQVVILIYLIIILPTIFLIRNY